MYPHYSFFVNSRKVGPTLKEGWLEET